MLSSFETSKSDWRKRKKLFRSCKFGGQRFSHHGYFGGIRIAKVCGPLLAFFVLQYVQNLNVQYWYHRGT
jgi:hypothetical protein